MILTDFSLRLAKHTWLLAPYLMISIVIRYRLIHSPGSPALPPRGGAC